MDNLFLQEYMGVNPRELSPLDLAYIGDCVFELLVRIKVMNHGNAPVAKLHKMAKGIVNAKAQSELFFRIQSRLTEEELAVFRRGRNAKSYTVPKNAQLIDYKHATGLEALFGFLFLDGQLERAIALFHAGLDESE